MIAFHVIRLPDHAHVTVDELDRDSPLLEVVDEQPGCEHYEIRPKRKILDRAVQKDVRAIVLDCLRLQNLENKRNLKKSKYILHECGHNDVHNV